MANEASEGSIAALLSALQLGDSFFPSGRYTLSHGLESFAQSGALADVADVETVLTDYLTHAVARSEAVAVAAANRAAACGDLGTVIAVDELLFAMKLATEASVSSTRTGRQLLITACRLSDDPILAAYQREVAECTAPGNQAVALGVLSAPWGIGPAEAAAIELHAYVTGLLGAALRLVRIDHAQTQSILHRLQPVAASAAVTAAQTDYRQMSSFAPVIEIMQMRHEGSYLRLFAS